MVKKGLILLLLCALTAGALAQQVPGKQLTFADYRGVPDTLLPYKAFTICNVTYSVNHARPCADGTIHFMQVKTQAGLNPQSWIKDKKSIIPEHRRLLLYHEQGHLDLFKVYSLELKHMLEENCFTPANYMQEMEAINQQLAAKYDQLQHAYDEQTGHGLDLPRQALWKRQIWALYQAEVNRKNSN